MYDICIAGAGISGAALAAVLGKKGFRIALVERNWNEPDEIIGELLQPGGVEKLKELGLEQALEGIDAQSIRGYAMLLDSEWLTLAYNPPGNNGDQYSEGYGFRYGRFVQGLRNQSESLDNVHRIQGNVVNFLNGSGKVFGVECLDDQGEIRHIQAKLTVISHGSGSKLGMILSKSSIKIRGYMLGLILKDTRLPHERHGHIILRGASPVLSYPVAGDKVRVLIDFPKGVSTPKGSARKQYLLDHVLPLMPEELQEAFQNAVEEGGYRAKPTCLLASRPIVREGVVLVGDSLNMRHPVTGGGMTVALTDVKAFSDKFHHPKDLDDAVIFNKAIRDFYRSRHPQNATLNILAYALYCVFRHPLLKRACFHYLKQGGDYAYGPMSILSGRSRSRSLLYRHFFAVAGYALLHQKKMRNGSSGNSVFIKSLSALFYSVRVLVPLVLDEIPRIYKSQGEEDTFHFRKEKKRFEELLPS